MSRLPARRPLSRGLALLLPLLLLPAVAPASSSAQPATAGTTVTSDGVDSLFTPLEDFTLAARNPAGRPATVRPRGFSAFRLDLGEARAELAPTGGTTTGPLEVTVPDPSGAPVTFSVVEQSVMEPELQAAHPEIRTYAGRAVDGTARSVSLGVTRLGFFASVRSPGGGESWYVDPAYRQTSATDYLSYYGAAVPADSAGLVERGPIDTERILAAAPPEAQRPAPDAIVTQRTFRMAFVTDPTYANYFGTLNVASAKAALLARTNQIYNDDLAIKFVLVDGTDKLNLDTVAKASGPNGPCGASPCYPATVYSGTAPSGCDGDLLTRNEFVLGQIIGADNFDIGHIGLGVNGGGIAGLGVVGGGSKASGCTGLPAPTGDFYAVDYFSHEVGHQMGGNHTFNGDQINCSATNRNGGGVPVLLEGTTVEPGSGSTVMAYAGICGQDNLQPHSDPYFSQRSIDEIDTIVTADPSTVSELQTIALDGFGTGDSLELTYPGQPSQTLTPGTAYNLGLSVTTAVQTLTGCLPTVAGYDSGALPTANGFTVAFDNDCAGRDLSRLGIGTASTGVAGVIGVQDNGGDETNQGTPRDTTNHAPRVTAPADKTIPARTPFTLTSAPATDIDNDPLTYLWEQNSDAGAVGTSLVNNTKRDGPLFRVFGAYANVSADGTLTTPSPGINVATGTGNSRTFPDMAQILANNTNAKSGTCPAAPPIPTPATGRSNVPVDVVECYAEFLPTADYGDPVAGASLDFRLTARDAVPEAGGTQSDEVTLTVNTAAGPFLVTSRGAAGTPATGGAQETINWDVNGTNAATLAPTVRILLSTDGGLTFPTELAANTPNDGSQSVALPDVSTTTARIKIEAVGNYFFDVNDTNFAINGSINLSSPGDQLVQYSDRVSTSITATAPEGQGQNLSLSASGLPGLSVARTAVTTTGAQFLVTAPVAADPGTYPITATLIGGGPTAKATSVYQVVVSPEDAAVSFTGARVVSAPSSRTPVTFRSSVTEPADGSPGDLSRATVTFVNRGDGAILCATRTSTAGVATCETTLPSTEATTVYNVGTVVAGNYRRDAPVDNATVSLIRGASTPSQTPAPPATSSPESTATVSRLATKTRIRLPRVEQVRGRESTPVTYAVVSSRRSVGAAGRVVIRVDGRKVRNATVPVVPKQGNKVVGGTYRLSRNLDLGPHKIKIRFKPTDPLAYRGSRSRTITLTVVRSR